MKLKKYSIYTLVIIILFIVINLLLIPLLKGYEKYRYYQVCKVVNNFSQALIDKDYDKAVAYIALKSDCGIKLDNNSLRKYMKKSVEYTIDTAQNACRHPDFKELKYFTIKTVHRVSESYSLTYYDKWNQYDVIVTFYCTDKFQENLSGDMYLHIDKVGREFKIISFSPPMGFLWPFDGESHIVIKLSTFLHLIYV